MPEYLAPGVFVEETSFRSKSIEGVSTTTTGFVGPTRYGPVNRVPDVLTSLADFERVYGDGQQLSFDVAGGTTTRVHNYMWHSVRAFFENGGRRLYVVRVLEDARTAAGATGTTIAATVTGTGLTSAGGFVPGTVRIRQLASTPSTQTLAPTRMLASGTLTAPVSGPVTVAWTNAAGAQTQVIDGTSIPDTATTLDRATGLLTADLGNAAPTGITAAQAITTPLLLAGTVLTATLNPIPAGDVTVSWTSVNGFAVTATIPAAGPGSAALDRTTGILSFDTNAEPAAGPGTATAAVTVNLNNVAFLGATLAPPPIGDVIVTWASGGNPQSITISGTTVAGTGTTLDRTTGALLVDTGAAPPDGAVQASWGGPARALRDDGHGGLFGTGETGSINYTTGTITLDTAPTPGSTWEIIASPVAARFPGAAGNGVLQLRARPGANLMLQAGALPASLAAGDLVRIRQTTDVRPDPRWYRVARPAAPAAPTLTPLDGGPAITVSPTVVQVARAVSVSVTFTRDGDKDPSGIWQIEPENGQTLLQAVLDYFSADPISEERARTLPVVLNDRLSAELLHEGDLVLTGGTDGSQPDSKRYLGREDPATDAKTGLLALEDIEDISIVAAPGLAGLGATDAFDGVGYLQSHCERLKYRVAVVDSVRGHSIGEVRQWRAPIDSKYMALYYPWVKILDPITRREIDLPPCGFVTGIYARNDINRAVFKAPANEVVNLAIGFERMVNRGQQEVLNPEGINCLRFFEGRGLRVWGARTLSSDPEWKYINVRRYFAYLERSIDRGTQWAVFEPNGPALWANVRRTIEDFLYNEFASGALLGDNPKQAYFVKCDRGTMTQNDLDNGRLICLIGVSPLKPAEFVIFRIGQWTADAKS